MLAERQNIAVRAAALRLHEARPERALGFVLVVRPASQPDVGGGRLTAAREGLDMIELEITAASHSASPCH